MYRNKEDFSLTRIQKSIPWFLWKIWTILTAFEHESHFITPWNINSSKIKKKIFEAIRINILKFKTFFVTFNFDFNLSSFYKPWWASWKKWFSEKFLHRHVETLGACSGCSTCNLGNGNSIYIFYRSARRCIFMNLWTLLILAKKFLIKLLAYLHTYQFIHK